MGYSISWIAVYGKAKADIFEQLHVRDTGEIDEANDAPISGAELPTGWYVLFLNDFTHPLVEPAALRALSDGCTVIACQVEEHVMSSASCCYKDGKHEWSMTHDSNKGLYDLDVVGTAPDFYSALHAANLKKQQDEGGEMARVDYIFDIPVAAAERMCGYRYDQWKFDWGEPTFTKLIQGPKR